MNKYNIKSKCSRSSHKLLYTSVCFASLLALMGFSSCSDQLNLFPHSAVSPDGITESDLPALRMGMYNSVQNNPGEDSYLMFDYVGGLLAKSSGNPLELINSTLSPLGSTVSNSWSGYFKALYQVNNVIQITENFDSELSQTISGEAHYFRAYIYSCLVTRWGDVPILKQNTLELVSRNPATSVWTFIEEDIETAISLLSGSNDYYYVSKNAAIALKARVKLHQGKLKEAATSADYLIDIAGYKLDDFGKIFRSQQNSEIIFAFKNLSAESSVNLSTLFYSYAHPNKGSWAFRPTSALMTLYDSNDLRKDISITSISGNDMVNKYPSGQTGTDPFIISRIAEMYLISAEAQGLQNGLGRLNDLRRKRGLDPVYPASQDSFIDTILLERKKELLAEGFLFYDLVRTNRGTEIGLLNYQHVLPIPGMELLLNPNLKPNPGY